MKKLILAIVSLILLSCGASKFVNESKKVIKGQWLLENITYSETGSFNVNLLRDTSKECFEGSNWQFIPNNNTGTYAILNESCTTGVRYFIFTIEEKNPTTGISNFILKPTDKKEKSETNQGFKLQLTQLSDETMQLQQTVTLEGKPFKINMNFSKILN